MDMLFRTSIGKPNLAAQKYHSLLINGLLKNNINVNCICGLPISKRTHTKSFWNIKNERQNLLGVNYLPFYNSPIPKFICFFLFSFVYTFLWCIKHHREGSVVCDVLNLPISFGAVLAARVLGVDVVGIITDIPGFMSFDTKQKASFLSRHSKKLNMFVIESCTKYVPLTEQMCDLINPHKKPYIVIEGLVDSDMVSIKSISTEEGKKHITYCGAIYKKYGVQMLLDAFLLVKNENLILDIYGDGDLRSEMLSYEKKDKRIVYHGVVPNKDSVKAQLKSFLLINPRPTEEEFTKYSFPSKNVEYMVSGVPLLTTKLAGMPSEYLPYVFIFDDESVNGYAKAIRNIVDMPYSLVKEKGDSAKKFVLNTKNNIVQASKLIKLITLK